MEHMKMRWKVMVRRGNYAVVTDEPNGEFWDIASVQDTLPNDTTGEATAKAICEEHNARLDGDEYRDALVALVKALDGTMLGKTSDCPMPHEYDAAKALIQEAP